MCPFLYSVYTFACLPRSSIFLCKAGCCNFFSGDSPWLPCYECLCIHVVRDIQFSRILSMSLAHCQWFSLYCMVRYCGVFFPGSSWCFLLGDYFVFMDMLFCVNTVQETHIPTILDNHIKPYQRSQCLTAQIECVVCMHQARLDASFSGKALPCFGGQGSFVCKYDTTADFSVPIRVWLVKGTTPIYLGTSTKPIWSNDYGAIPRYIPTMISGTFSQQVRKWQRQAKVNMDFAPWGVVDIGLQF